MCSKGKQHSFHVGHNHACEILAGFAIPSPWGGWLHLSRNSPKAHGVDIQLTPTDPMRECSETTIERKVLSDL